MAALIRAGGAGGLGRHIECGGQWAACDLWLVRMYADGRVRSLEQRKALAAGRKGAR